MEPEDFTAVYLLFFHGGVGIEGGKHSAITIPPLGSTFIIIHRNRLSPLPLSAAFPNDLSYYLTSALVHGIHFHQNRHRVGKQGRESPPTPKETSSPQELAAFPTSATPPRDHHSHLILCHGLCGALICLGANSQHVPSHLHHPVRRNRAVVEG